MSSSSEQPTDSQQPHRVLYVIGDQKFEPGVPYVIKRVDVGKCTACGATCTLALQPCQHAVAGTANASTSTALAQEAGTSSRAVNKRRRNNGEACGPNTSNQQAPGLTGQETESMEVVMVPVPVEAPRQVPASRATTAGPSRGSARASRSKSARHAAPEPARSSQPTVADEMDVDVPSHHQQTAEEPVALKEEATVNSTGSLQPASCNVPSHSAATCGDSLAITRVQLDLAVSPDNEQLTVRLSVVQSQQQTGPAADGSDPLQQWAPVPRAIPTQRATRTTSRRPASHLAVAGIPRLQTLDLPLPTTSSDAAMEEVAGKGLAAALNQQEQQAATTAAASMGCDAPTVAEMPGVAGSSYDEANGAADASGGLVATRRSCRIRSRHNSPSIEALQASATIASTGSAAWALASSFSAPPNLGVQQLDAPPRLPAPPPKAPAMATVSVTVSDDMPASGLSQGIAVTVAAATGAAAAAAPIAVTANAAASVGPAATAGDQASGPTVLHRLVEVKYSDHKAVYVVAVDAAEATGEDPGAAVAVAAAMSAESNCFPVLCQCDDCAEKPHNSHMVKRKPTARPQVMRGQLFSGVDFLRHVGVEDPNVLHQWKQHLQVLLPSGVTVAPAPGPGPAGAGGAAGPSVSTGGTSFATFMRDQSLVASLAGALQPAVI